MARLEKVEIMTVRELIKKVQAGEWKYDITTQRQFIYNSDLIKKVNPGCGNITKAAYVIYNILEANVILPAITLWHNTDTETYNIHDGKQRSLSLYYFVTGEAEVTIYRNKKTISNFECLSEDDQNKILDYQIVVQYNVGTSEEEKNNFYEVNSNSINLTPYENLRAVCYGTYLYSLEDYIKSLKNLDNVKPVERGDQLYKLLLAHFDINDSKQAGSADTARKLLRKQVELRVDRPFDATENNFELMIEVFNSLSNIKFSGTSKTMPEDIALAIAHYVVRNYPARYQDVIDLYRDAAKGRNDILKWASDFNNNNIQTHKCFIKSFLDQGIKLDPRRYFDESEKEAIIKRDGQRCSHIDKATGEQCTETSYSKLEVDHVIPWSLGGRTDISNGKLLCKSHNASKGNRLNA